MQEYYITLSFRQFTKTLSQFFDLPRASKNLNICMLVCFVQMNESKQFWDIFCENNVLINGHYFKNSKKRFRWTLLCARMIWILYDCHLQWSSCSKNFFLWIPARFQFVPALDIKRLGIVGKIFEFCIYD